MSNINEERLARRMPANTRGRDIIVGDIHGCYTALWQLLYKIEHDANVDRLFLLGDLADRGLESSQASDWTQCSIRGNHEQIILDYMEGYVDQDEVINAGGRWFLEQTPDYRERYYQAILTMPYAIEIEHPKGRIGLVHADCPMDWEVMMLRLHSIKSRTEQDRKFLESLVDNRDRTATQDTTSIPGISCVFVGHTPVEQVPYILGNVTFMDSGAVNGGGLSACVIEQSGNLIFHTVPTEFVPDDH